MSETTEPNQEPAEPNQAAAEPKDEAIELNESSQPQGGLPPALNLGCGGFALLIALGGMLMLVGRAIVDLVSGDPPMERESYIGVSIGVGVWFLLGWFIFRRGLAQREAGMGLAEGTSSLLRRIVTWIVEFVLALFIIALLKGLFL